MTKFLYWISANPSAFASLVSAIIAASVALIVFTVTQFLASKKERTQFLTPKLETLYLLLNKVSEDNTKFFKLIYLILDGNSQAREQLAAMDDLELYGHRTSKEALRRGVIREPDGGV
jgi:hypothetical protein